MMNQRDIDELTEVFVEESQEIVENLNKDILELEKEVGNSTVNHELLNNIFRYVHTLKGNSGLAGADKLRDLAHKMESLLDRLRKDKIALSPEIVDILFAGIDRIGAILREVINGVDQGVVIADVVEKLETVLSGKPPESKGTSLSEPPVREKKAPESPPVPQPSSEKGAASIPAPLQATIPSAIQRILTEYEEKRLLEHLKNHHSIYEAVLNLLMDGFEQVVTEVIDRINTVGEVIAKVPSSKTLPRYDLQMRVIFASSLLADALIASIAEIGIIQPEDFSVTTLIVPPVKPAPVTANPPVVPPPQPAVKSPEPAAPVKQPAAKKNGAKPIPEKPQRKPAQEESQPKPTVTAVKDIADQSGNIVRVDIKKLDNLMNIVGELVLAKARYVQLESALNAAQVHKTVKDSLRQTNKLTSKRLEDLREGILQVRMVQVGSLFNLYPRLVRDLCKDHNKQIRLILEGQETELDKAVIDEMKDPLMHLIRNSVDHGIEDPQTRKDRGKPETGTITLRAYQEGSYIVIEVQDDGRGIEVERIREKAIESGLTDKMAKLTESEILNFIFHPGFSTAKIVTNTSGRGVGMDVVKVVVTKLKGMIDTQTTPGVGTKFIIKLPLTLAIIQVLLITVNMLIYAIPLSSVTESFRLNPEKIEIIDGQEVTQLRDVVLPLLRLGEAFGTRDAAGEWKTIFSSPEEMMASERETSGARKFVVVTELAERQIGLVVDDLLEQEEIVIKPLGRYLANIPGFAGATTLGDGRIVLILDIVRLIEDLNKQRLNLLRQLAVSPINNDQHG